MTLYTGYQWFEAEHHLTQCYTDYMTYCDQRHTEQVDEHLTAYVIARQEIQTAMVNHKNFKEYVDLNDMNESYETISLLFNMGFEQWLDNRYLSHIKDTGYRLNTELSPQQREQHNYRGQLLIRIIEAIATTLNDDGSKKADQ